MTAWDDQRPTYNRLPYHGYQNNSVADALTSWHDGYLSAKKQQLEQFYLELHPDTCQDVSLDYLAFLVGLSGDYYNTQWSTTVKRNFIRYAVWLMANRGTVECIQKCFQLLGLTAKLWYNGQVVLPFQLSPTLGSADMRVYIRLPISYPRGEYEWQEARRVKRCYVPAAVSSKVVYDRFYLGMSRLSEPLFTK